MTYLLAHLLLSYSEQQRAVFTLPTFPACPAILPLHSVLPTCPVIFPALPGCSLPHPYAR